MTGDGRTVTEIRLRDDTQPSDFRVPLPATKQAIKRGAAPARLNRNGQRLHSRQTAHCTACTCRGRGVTLAECPSAAPLRKLGTILPTCVMIRDAPKPPPSCTDMDRQKPPRSAFGLREIVFLVVFVAAICLVAALVTIGY